MHCHRSQTQVLLNNHPIFKYHLNHQMVLNCSAPYMYFQMKQVDNAFRKGLIQIWKKDVCAVVQNAIQISSDNVFIFSDNAFQYFCFLQQYELQMQFKLYSRKNKRPGNILNNRGYDQLKKMSSILKYLKVLELCLGLFFQFPFW